MKQVVALLCLVGSAVALPLSTPAVSNGVFLEEAASRPTFAKGIRTDCEYMHQSATTLGHVPAEGDLTEYTTIEKAKAVCDEMGPNCGGIVETEDVDGTDGRDPGTIFFRLYHGHILKSSDEENTVHLKTLCALPLPQSNFVPADSKVLHGAILKVNDAVEGLRWKLSNGPTFHRYDDNRDHGRLSRLTDGRSSVMDVDECQELCAKKSDCNSGHYCKTGAVGHAGACQLSGDWDPHGLEINEYECSLAQNFRKNHDWIKPVLRLDDGTLIKHQWHSKKPIDEARAEDYGRF